MTRFEAFDVHPAGSVSVSVDATGCATATAGPGRAPAGQAAPFQFYESGVAPLLYPIASGLFILVATMDIILTWIILSLGGLEVNPVAALVIDAWGLPGAIAFKYALTVFVIIVAEAVGRHRGSAGRMLSIAAVVISAVPVIWSTGLLLSLAAHG